MRIGPAGALPVRAAIAIAHRGIDGLRGIAEVVRAPQPGERGAPCDHSQRPRNTSSSSARSTYIMNSR